MIILNFVLLSRVIDYELYNYGKICRQDIKFLFKSCFFYIMKYRLYSEISSWAYLANKIFFSEISPMTYARIKFFSSFEMRLKIHFYSESRSAKIL